MHVAEKKLIALTKRPHLSQLERQQSSDPFAHLRVLLKALGNPEEKIPHYIHITGTSGKGSTAAFLAGIWQANGVQVGLTISPHIATMRERWQINGEPISTREFAGLVKKITHTFNQCVQKNPHFGLSFFELCTALALLYFAKNHVEWVVLEVFNGGLIDPTNIIPHKDAAIITTVALDHEHLLGKTTATIARNKAGIIGQNTPTFSTVSELNTKKVLRTAAKKKQAPIFFVTAHQKYSISAIGTHQQRNAALAATVARHFKISERVIARGLKNTTLPLRLEVVSTKPFLILDSAHNPQKIQATVAAVKTLKLKPLAIVVSFSPRKNIKAMVRELMTLQPARIFITTGPNDRPFTTPESIAMAFPKRAPTTIITDPHQALAAAQALGPTLVTGSLYLSAWYKNHQKNKRG